MHKRLDSLASFDFLDPTSGLLKTTGFAFIEEVGFSSVSTVSISAVYSIQSKSDYGLALMAN